MKKGNWTVLGIAVVASVILLGLWVGHGFHHVDAPLDPMMAVAWWLILAGSVFVVNRAEDERKRRVRTCFVTNNVVFNSEAGQADLMLGEDAVDRVRDVIEGLDYNFEVNDLPESVRFEAVVRSSRFERTTEVGPDGQPHEVLHWEGEVAFPRRPKDDPMPFSGEDELRGILLDATRRGYISPRRITREVVHGAPARTASDPA